MLMKTLLPLLLALGLTTTASAGPVLDRIKTSGRIVIAHREASVPFSYLLPDGRPVGYAVDLCLKVAEAVRQPLHQPIFKCCPRNLRGSRLFRSCNSSQWDLGSCATTAMSRWRVRRPTQMDRYRWTPLPMTKRQRRPPG